MKSSVAIPYIGRIGCTDDDGDEAGTNSGITAGAEGDEVNVPTATERRNPLLPLVSRVSRGVADLHNDQWSDERWLAERAQRR